jgi:hypothetical protein
MVKVERLPKLTEGDIPGAIALMVESVGRLLEYEDFLIKKRKIDETDAFELLKDGVSWKEIEDIRKGMKKSYSISRLELPEGDLDRVREFLEMKLEDYKIHSRNYCDRWVMYRGLFEMIDGTKN